MADIQPIHEDEAFFYYEPEDAAWHNRLVFFTATSRSNDVIDMEAMVREEESESPHWVHIDEVRVEDLQPALDRIFPLVRDEIRRRMGL